MKQEVSFSDLTGQMLSDPNQITKLIVDHPDTDGPRALEVHPDEVAGLADLAIKTVGVSIQGPEDVEPRKFTLTAEAFATLAGDKDIHTILSNAERAKFVRRGLGNVGINGAGTTEKRGPEESLRIRSWARENGWPEMKDKGKIPDAALSAYDKAHEHQRLINTLGSEGEGQPDGEAAPDAATGPAEQPTVDVAETPDEAQADEQPEASEPAEGDDELSSRRGRRRS